MKWTLILRLSLVGLALAVASVFFISPNLEPLLWLGVFLYYAYAIGKNTHGFRFLHGLVLGILTSVWVSAMHEIFLARYLDGHPREIAMINMVHAANITAGRRVIMSLTGTTVGLLEGIVIGVFAVVSGMMVEPKRLDLTIEREVVEPDTRF